jgi:hypothetical protein
VSVLAHQAVSQFFRDGFADEASTRIEKALKQLGMLKRHRV